MDVGRNVRRIRKEQRYTQTEIARRCGVTPAAISGLEAGDFTPSTALVIKMARALDVEPGELLKESPVSVPLAEGLPRWASTSDIADFSERVSKLSAEDLGRLAEALALSAPPVRTREDPPLPRQEGTERVISHARMLVVHNKFIAEGIQPPRRFTIAYRRGLEALAGPAQLEGEAEADHGEVEVG